MQYRHEFVGTSVAAAVMIVAALLPTAAGAQANRSAQGDCEQEARRRGYEILRTGQFLQIDDGWRVELSVRDRQGRIDEGVCTVRTSTGQVSFAGFEFGGGGGGLRFTCESQSQKYSECQLPVDGRVRLVRRLSKSPCDEGRSWGQRGNRVWVSQGCRGEFEVDHPDRPGG